MVGGGNETLEEYLIHYAKAECIELHTRTNMGDGSLRNTVGKLLVDNSGLNASENKKLKDRYVKESKKSAFD